MSSRGPQLALFLFVLTTGASVARAEEPAEAPSPPPLPTDAPEPPDSEGPAEPPDPPAPPPPPAPAAPPPPAWAPLPPSHPRPPPPSWGPNTPYGYRWYGPTYGPPIPPKTLEYHEGEPPPPGYRFDTRVRRGFVIAGGTTLGSTYLISVGVAAAFQEDNDAEAFVPLFVPVVGPFITVGTAAPTPFATAVLVLDGLAQTVGLGMFIYGLVDPEKVWVRQRLGFDLTPIVLGDELMGLGASGAF